MPAMITHYLLARRTLAVPTMPPIADRDAFLLGAQGPDIFFFFRAYPWLLGEKGLPLGNALHEARPSYLMDALRAVVDEFPVVDRPIAESYALGLLCHYAADRTVHPYVIATQETMAVLEPSYADDSNPYHYRIESAIDTCVLHRDMGERVSSFALSRVVPKCDKHRDKVLAQLYHRLLRVVLGVDRSPRALCRLTADMRHSMVLMTDRSGVKRAAFRLLERFSEHGAWYSSLIRTDDVAWYDFMNETHATWTDGELQRAEDVYALCDTAVALAADLACRFRAGEDGLTLTEDIDFAGHRFEDKGEVV